MSLFAHHEAVLVVQGLAGLTVAGLSAAFLTSWSTVRNRITSRNGEQS